MDKFSEELRYIFPEKDLVLKKKNFPMAIAGIIPYTIINNITLFFQKFSSQFPTDLLMKSQKQPKGNAGGIFKIILK